MTSMEHSNYICKKCGLTCHSKDPGSRSIFYHNQKFALLKSAIQIDMGFIAAGHPSETEEERRRLFSNIAKASSFLGMQPEAAYERLACYHDWMDYSGEPIPDNEEISA